MGIFDDLANEAPANDSRMSNNHPTDPNDMHPSWCINNGEVEYDELAKYDLIRGGE